MPKLTKAQRRELERKQAAKTRLVFQFCKAVLPRDFDAWRPRYDELREAALGEARAVESAQTELTRVAFLMALQSEILRRRLAAERAENARLRKGNLSDPYPSFSENWTPPGKRGRRSDVWKNWFQPMNLRSYGFATGLGQTQLKKWLLAIPARDAHFEPAPKERGKGREKNYRWPVNREILSRWLLLTQFTPQQRREWIVSLLALPEHTDEEWGLLLDLFAGSSAIRQAANLTDDGAFERLRAEAKAQREQAQAAKEKERSESMKTIGLGFPFFGGLSDTSSPAE